MANRSSNFVNSKKLRHDLKNDIGSLRMNLEAIKLSRDEPDVHQELIDLMLDTVKDLEVRIESAMKILQAED